MRYLDGKPVEIEKILVSTQHAPRSPSAAARRPSSTSSSRSCQGLTTRQAAKNLLVNPTGRFVSAADGDCWATGSKIIVDTYGGRARHGGGAFSGKDPSKVDRSAAYAARHVAKNIVAAGLAGALEVQIAYAIGVADPSRSSFETIGTEKIGRGHTEQLIDEHFDLRPAPFATR